MSVFKYTAQSKEQMEINRSGLLFQGYYHLHILKAEEHVSRSGNNMVRLTLSAQKNKFSTGGKWITDYLINNEKFGHKIYDLYKSMGHEDLYFKEEIDLDFITGKWAFGEVGVKPAKGEYGPSNCILKYCSGSELNIKEENLVPIASVKKDEEFDDEIPF